MSESTELTIHEQTELAEWLKGQDTSVAGDENLQPGDLAMPPRLRISQPNSPIETGEGVAAPGSIVNTLTGETSIGLEVVPLVFMSRTRVKWPQGFKRTNDPMCASDDAEFPALPTDARKLTDPQSGPCGTCMDAEFGEDGTAPLCKLQRNFLVMVLGAEEEQPEPAILTLSSTALTAARKLTSLSKTQGLIKSVRFTTQQVKKEQGMWYVPAFTKGRKLPLGALVILIEARDELQKLVITADTEVRNGHTDDAQRERDDIAIETHGEDEEIPF